MGRYRAVFDGNGMLAEYEDEELVWLREDYKPPNASDLAKPMVIRDIEPYKNMIDGRMISSRSEHRELLRRHNCVEIGNEKMETKPIVPKKVDRRQVLHQQLADMSDRQANKIIKKALKGR
ncbi:MAG: hypothetical protein AMJ72_02805 [Acidithiobacillales bacterium SM1_46]|nr:MAG: hypothetical protein AMJ72_02805 [Acidithiobacillales bacterium SM1_46]